MGVRAIVVIAINEVVQFFNVGKTMNKEQVASTADLIISKYFYLNLEELKFCFREAMCSGKVFDRLDGNIILGWLREYDAKRDEYVTLQSINEANAHKSESSATGMFYGEYIARLQKKADEGDEEARSRLEMHKETSARLQKPNKEEEFKKWKEQYYNNGKL